VIALLFSMVLNAGVAAVQRTGHRYRGIWIVGFVAAAGSSVVTTATVTEIVLDVTPWYSPRYLIPLFGMVLGNSLTGISLSLERLLSGVRTKRAEIEDALCMGATRWEAVHPLLVDAVRTGMIPIINSMSVVGIVSLPGMMTGQILSGSDPAEAARYQVVVMFMVACACSLGALIACLLSYRHVFTARHQLAADRVVDQRSPRLG